MDEEKNNQNDHPIEEKKYSGKKKFKYQNISESELKELLENHQKWLQSDGKEGKSAFALGMNLEKAQLKDANLKNAWLNLTNLQSANLNYANLQNADLTSADLKNASLCHANLQNASLNSANIENADLSNANLQNADLCVASLQYANLHRTNFSNAYLNNANLDNAFNLMGSEFGGADLAGAKLPMQINEFPPLIEAEKIIKNAKKILIGQQFSLLILLAYSWFTILNTKDVQLISNLKSITLPIIVTEIPVSLYYWIVPIVLFSIYVYLNHLLKNLFSNMAILPAIFPHGKAIDQIGFPWVVNSLLRSYFFRLKSKRSIFNYFQVYISNFFIWFAMPVTLFLFWSRYLLKHDWYGTFFHSLLFILSIWTGIALHSQAISSFNRKAEKAESKKSFLIKIFQMTIILTFLVLMIFISHSVLNGIHPEIYRKKCEYSKIYPKVFIPLIFIKLGYDPIKINLRGEKLDWTNLTNTYLRFANATGASFKGAQLDGADCKHANFKWADMEKASLIGTNMEFANLTSAKLKDVNLSGANLKRVKGLTQMQIMEACGDKHTQLPLGYSIKICPANF